MLKAAVVMVGCYRDAIMMRWIVGLTLSVALGCSSNTIDLEDEGGGDGTASPASSDGNGDGGTTGSDGGDPTGALTTAMTSPTTVAPDTGDVPLVGPAPGRYLFVFDTVVQPGTPLQWEAWISREPDAMTGQSLTLGQGSTTDPREPIGGVWDAKFAVEPDGSFTIGVVPLAITGEANPITGSDVVTSEMALESQGPLCGILVAGELTEPLPLDLLGSTFALVPVGEGEPWPTEFPLGC